LRFTNKFDLPDTFVNAVTHDTYHQDGDISATGLIEPPRIRQLKKRRGSDIVIDVADQIYLMYGKMWHYIMEQYKAPGAIVEKRVSTNVSGWKVTGQADLWEKEDLYDHKFTTIWSYIYGLKPEWESQTNIYASLFRKERPVKRLWIIMALRDWQKRNVNPNDTGYPGVPIVKIPVPIWPEAKAMEYIEERVHLHQMCESLPDDRLPVCTAQERWEKPTMYRVMKKGAKRASRVLETMEEAEAWMEEKKGDYSVEVRQGESVRCESYCDVSSFCSFKQSKSFKEFFGGGE
jgi:hypothetical protein